MGSTKNFAEYRDTLHKANPPCIPFFGTHIFPWPFPCYSNFIRCISHGSYFYWRRHPFAYKEDQPYQLCKACKDSGGYSRHSTISKCAISSAASSGAAGLHTDEYAIGWRCSWDVWHELAGWASRKRGREDSKVCWVCSVNPATSLLSLWLIGRNMLTGWFFPLQASLRVRIPVIPPKHLVDWLCWALVILGAIFLVWVAWRIPLQDGNMYLWCILGHLLTDLLSDP